MWKEEGVGRGVPREGSGPWGRSGGTDPGGHRRSRHTVHTLITPREGVGPTFLRRFRKSPYKSLEKLPKDPTPVPPTEETYYPLSRRELDLKRGENVHGDGVVDGGFGVIRGRDTKFRVGFLTPTPVRAGRETEGTDHLSERERGRDSSRTVTHLDRRDPTNPGTERETQTPSEVEEVTSWCQINHTTDPLLLLEGDSGTMGVVLLDQEGIGVLSDFPEAKTTEGTKEVVGVWKKVEEVVEGRWRNGERTGTTETRGVDPYPSLDVSLGPQVHPSVKVRTLWTGGMKRGVKVGGDGSIEI